MADQKPTDNNPKMLGGVNQKVSDYTLNKSEFFNLRNLDFDVPNALQKRPGSTQSIVANTSGPVTALHEFIKLDGSSTVIVGTDTAMFYMNAATLQPLDTGWSNGQPADMLTFVNKAWMANGAKFYGWSGVGSTPLPTGLPPPPSLGISGPGADGGGSWMLAGGATMWYLASAGTSAVLRGVYFAYSYLRNDGLFGPADFLRSAKNVVRTSFPSTSGAEYFTFNNLIQPYGGFTIPSGRGITSVAVWVAVDSIVADSPREFISGVGATAQVGNLGWLVGGGGILSMSITLKPTADLTRFWLYTMIPASSLGSGTATLIPNFNNYTGIATGQGAFTGIAFPFSETYVPKYIEINQNSMFMAGFSNTPSNVWFSELGQPENIQPENFFEVRTNDGDRVFAIKNYNNQLIVLKQNSFHRVIGDSPDNFQLIEISNEYGCLSNQTVVEYQEKLAWLDQKGILQFNGAGWEIISNSVEDIFRRMNLDAAKEKACAVHHLDRNQIWWGIPIDGATQNNITVVYDYLVDAWTFFDGFNPSTFSLLKGSLNRPTAFRGSYSGMIYHHSASFFGDNGQGITCLGVPHWDKNKENETWIWRRFFLDVATVSGLTGQIRGNLYSNYDLNTVQGTFSSFQSAFQSRSEFGVVGKAVTCEFSHFSASLPLLINNYSWAKRFLRNV